MGWARKVHLERWSAKMLDRDPKKFAPANAAALDAPQREDFLPSSALVSLLERSRHIALGEVPDRLTELPADKPVAFICRSGARSSVAAAEAAKQIGQVSDVRGGMLAWSAAGLPVTTHSLSGN